MCKLILAKNLNLWSIKPQYEIRKKTTTTSNHSAYVLDGRRARGWWLMAGLCVCVSCIEIVFNNIHEK